MPLAALRSASVALSSKTFIAADLIKEENLPIHYVALFQTPRIFSDRTGIHYYGEVLSTELVRGKEIQAIPATNGNPDGLYYLFRVRKWIRTKNSISPKETGFVYNFTNMFLLENAEFVPELLLRSAEEYRFYVELKRRTGAVLEKDESPKGFEVGDTRVFFDNGEIQLYRKGCAPVKCSIAEFSRRPNATFRRMQEYAALGVKCVSGDGSI